jgi:competence ComEA-like helix-hairpin-helix protein
MFLDHYHFTRKELRGILTFAFCCTILYAGFYFFTRISSQDLVFEKLDKAIVIDSVTKSQNNANLVQDVTTSIDEASKIGRSNQVINGFLFDPNIISKDSLLLLGINTKAANNLIKYRNKGGSFKLKADLKKVYGLSDDEYNYLKEYINLPDKFESKKAETKKEPMQILSRTLEFVDINTADSLDWIKLYGIGPVYASRIIKFRSKLGGFHSPEQLLEVYGINDTVYMNIIPNLLNDNIILTKININTCDFKTLNNHPYIEFKIAKHIMSYRDNHGPFSNVEAIKKIKTIDDALFNKISPYLTTTD